MNTTIAHSHEQNARVERVNKELKRHLVNYCQDNRIRNHWTRALPAVQYIINSTKNQQTGYTPFELLFGPAVNDRQFNPNPVLQGDMAENEFTEWLNILQKNNSKVVKQA